MHVNASLFRLAHLAFGLLASSFVTLCNASYNCSGFTDQVLWDGYSFAVQTPEQTAPQRIFVHSGEVHPFRLPVPDLRHDICQKVKAAGLNSISFYAHWALMNPKDGVLDFEGFNNIQGLLDAAKDAGLWVIARPGPYIKFASNFIAQRFEPTDALF